MRLALLVAALLFGTAAAEAACPSSARVGQVVTVSGKVKSADVLMIFVDGCGVGVSIEVDSWTKKCRPGRQLSATGVYHETPMPFSPIPNISDIRKLTCGSEVIL